jgi:hypothetical protein
MIEPICRLHPFKRAVDVTFFSGNRPSASPRTKRRC